MEQNIQILIYVHAIFGGIALLSGFISLITKKGLHIHKKAGLTFYYSMICSGITAMIVTLLPNHENPFLFSVGVFSLYFVLAGYRALKFKTPNINLTIDKWISSLMLVTGVLMIIIPIIVSQNVNIVLLVFGIVGIVFSTRDLMHYKNPQHLQEKWLKLHLGKMIGGLISATTAFVVVNAFFSDIFNWLLPGIIGAFVVVYWIRKINKTKKPLSKKVV